MEHPYHDVPGITLLYGFSKIRLKPKNETLKGEVLQMILTFDIQVEVFELLDPQSRPQFNVISRMTMKL